jgi:hypothetical protein
MLGAAAIKDPDLAALGPALLKSTHSWLESKCVGQRAPAPAFEDAARLVQSRLADSIITGARCASVIATGRPDGLDLMVALFKSVPAKARCLLLRYGTGKYPDLVPISNQLVRLGLVDRSQDVRWEAVSCIQEWRAADFLPALRNALTVERRAELRTVMERAIDHVMNGFWIGPSEPNGLCPFEISKHDGLQFGWIPAFLFESITKDECGRRLMQSGPENQRWYLQTMADWERRQGTA